MSYKCCLVPHCNSNSHASPNKMFFHVPNSDKIRKQWFDLARMVPFYSQENLVFNRLDYSRSYFCEDHFNLPSDLSECLLSGCPDYLKACYLPTLFDGLTNYSNDNPPSSLVNPVKLNNTGDTDKRKYIKSREINNPYYITLKNKIAVVRVLNKDGNINNEKELGSHKLVKVNNIVKTSLGMVENCESGAGHLKTTEYEIVTNLGNNVSSGRCNAKVVGWGLPVEEYNLTESNKNLENIKSEIEKGLESDVKNKDNVFEVSKNCEVAQSMKNTEEIEASKLSKEIITGINISKSVAVGCIKEKTAKDTPTEKTTKSNKIVKNTPVLAYSSIMEDRGDGVLAKLSNNVILEIIENTDVESSHIEVYSKMEAKEHDFMIDPSKEVISEIIEHMRKDKSRQYKEKKRKDAINDVNFETANNNHFEATREIKNRKLLENSSNKIIFEKLVENCDVGEKYIKEETIFEDMCENNDLGEEYIKKEILFEEMVEDYDVEKEYIKEEIEEITIENTNLFDDDWEVGETKGEIVSKLNKDTISEMVEKNDHEVIHIKKEIEDLNETEISRESFTEMVENNVIRAECIKTSQLQDGIMAKLKKDIISEIDESNDYRSIHIKKELEDIIESKLTRDSTILKKNKNFCKDFFDNNDVAVINSATEKEIISKLSTDIISDIDERRYDKVEHIKKEVKGHAQAESSNAIILAILENNDCAAKFMNSTTEERIITKLSKGIVAEIGINKETDFTEADANKNIIADFVKTNGCVAECMKSSTENKNAEAEYIKILKNNVNIDKLGESIIKSTRDKYMNKKIEDENNKIIKLGGKIVSDIIANDHAKTNSREYSINSDIKDNILDKDGEHIEEMIISSDDDDDEHINYLKNLIKSDNCSLNIVKATIDVDPEDLYKNHIIKDEMVIGPETFQKVESKLTVDLRCKQDKIKRSVHCNNCQMVYDSMKWHKCLYICEICKKCFSERSKIEIHLQQHLLKNKCNVCGKCFSFSSNLSRHMKIHSGAKAHKCNQCELTFSRRDYLTFHIQKHHSNIQLPRIDRTSICKLCNKVFSTKCSRDAHMKFSCPMNENKEKQKLKSYTCNVCKKAYPYRTSLQAHIARRHMKRKALMHECDYCGKKYQKKHNLQCHIQAKHLKLKPYPCKFCDMSFTWQSCLASHEKKAHKKVKKKLFSLSTTILKSCLD